MMNTFRSSLKFLPILQSRIQDANVTLGPDYSIDNGPAFLNISPSFQSIYDSPLQSSPPSSLFLSPHLHLWAKLKFCFPYSEDVVMIETSGYLKGQNGEDMALETKIPGQSSIESAASPETYAVWHCCRRRQYSSDCSVPVDVEGALLFPVFLSC